MSAALFALAAWAATASAEPASPLFALVVGNNRPAAPEVAPLRYADDDAVQNAELMTELGAQTVLLTRLDLESRELYPNVQATAPTRGALAQAWDELDARMGRERERGASPVLFVFYGGHGDVENNQGYVALEDGRLTRDELLDRLRATKASTVHLVVDACKSYFLAFERGERGERVKVAGPLVGPPRGLPANVGVLLSTSSAVESHEWEAFQAGIFSHEVRSAFRGAADVDLDGRITYDELAAFVWAANASIPNRKYRPEIFARPPQQGSVLVAPAGGDRVEVGPGVDRHVFVEDDRGRRLGDLHPGAAQRAYLRLPPSRPLFVRVADDRTEATLTDGGVFRIAELRLAPSSANARGAEHVAFSRLFANAFDAAAVTAWRERPSEPEPALSAGRSPVRWGAGIGAGLFGTSGAVLTALALNDYRSAGPSTTGVERAWLNDRIDRFNVAAVTCYALAGAALALLVWLTIWGEGAP
jgi:hypothetical protein